VGDGLNLHHKCSQYHNHSRQQLPRAASNFFEPLRHTVVISFISWEFVFPTRLVITS
jgi:hypothetical protein